MQLREYMEKHTVDGGYGLLRTFPRIKCKDGFSISIQAGSHAYCSPRDDSGDWHKLEAGFPSGAPSDELAQYAESTNAILQTVYPYVPIETLQRELDLHGGIEGSYKHGEQA